MTTKAKLERELSNLLERLPPGTEAVRQELTKLYEAVGQELETFAYVKAALDQFPFEVYVKDEECRFVFANRYTEGHYSGLSGGLAGKSDFDLFPQDRAEEFYKEEKRLLTEGAHVRQQRLCTRIAGGQLHWYDISKFPVFDEEGHVVGLSGFSRAASDDKQTEILLGAQTAILEQIVANRPILEIYEQICSLIEGQLPGVVSSIVLLDENGERFGKVIAPSIDKSYSAALHGLAIGEKVGSCGSACYFGQPVFVSDIDNDERWQPYKALVGPFGFKACWSTPFFDVNGSVIGSFALYADAARMPYEIEEKLMSLGRRLAEIVVERDRAADEIKLTAQRDGLTKLPNRNAFAGLLQQKLMTAREENRRLTVVFMDIDAFKPVNDQYGHAVGDELLRVISQRLSAAVGEEGLVARLSGDEFAFAIAETEGENLEERLMRIVRFVDMPVNVQGIGLTVSSGRGASVYPDHGNTAESLMAKAEDALNSAKIGGRDQCRYYDPDSDADIQSRTTWAEELRAGISSSQIDLDFQPVFSLPDGHAYGFEALARWQHPRLGRLMPGSFIALAEETGLIVPLGRAVLVKACQQAVRWMQETGVEANIAVNVSAHQFRNGEVLEQVRWALRETGLPPRLLELELTESVLLENEHAAIAIMSELKQLGVFLAIDDFGTGFSNLSALARFPVDRIKIDRSIIQDIPANKAAASITSAIIAMAQQLGMQILGEGVETEDQLRFLVDAGCNSVQGYYLGRPILEAKVVDFLQREEMRFFQMPDRIPRGTPFKVGTR